MPLFIALPGAFLLSLIAAYVGYIQYKKRKINKIMRVLREKREVILESTTEKDENKETIELEWKLRRAGIVRREYYQILVLIYFTALVLMVVPYFFVSLNMAIMLGLSGVGLVIFGPNMYLESEKNARVEKIDHDLSTFLDLVVIILEAGGGLKNALNEVTHRGRTILCKELVGEIKILENELTNYDADTAYDNLVKRTGSKHIASLVDFLKLADETGIGVKTIFESQSQDIKDEAFFEVEKKGTVINLYLTMVVFMFLLPALAGFIVFPMMEGNLMQGMIG